ncbi:hypothetical protein A3860_34240 [Niastella vici]|uniref:DUF3347 domain-containing protein n=1 Tax=Niastella vici TaxID=1703345 RepID=A0A1V9FP83_9BACT|nr:DUF3347 domain-containing protein [Niastella vici]OQP60142.1 hypothetical protein A3860_34240 [Niastella vici]
MKTFLSIFFMAASLFAASCNGNSNPAKETDTKNADSTTTQAAPTGSEQKTTDTPGTINDLVTGYLNLKNALASDDGKQAATAANEMGSALTKVNASELTGDQKKVYDDVKDDIKEHAEHIGSNASNIAHQREHFDMLSKDMIDLVKATGSSTTLYHDFCPMYNNKKGASWLSEKKDIKNPYLGKSMPTCGEVKEEFKPKG